MGFVGLVAEERVVVLLLLEEGFLVDGDLVGGALLPGGFLAVGAFGLAVYDVVFAVEH